MTPNSTALQMLTPPFSRPISLPRLSSTAGLINDTASNTSAFSSTESIRYILPAAVRYGNTLARTKDDPGAYYTRELRTERLDEIKSYLWLAGLPSCGRPLHRQRLLGRQVIITEDPNEHLVWHERRIFIKPLPIFLVDLDCWTKKLCKSRQLHEAACGFILSYAWLVRHESDLRIAHEIGLLPKVIDWATWTDFISNFLEHVDLQSLSGVSARYQYGELRLSRLNKIYRITHFSWRYFVRGYMTSSTWYQDFFGRNFAWVLFVFAFLSVALSAMQVVLAIPRGNLAFENASYGFSVASLLLVAGSMFAVLLLWLILLIYHLVSAQRNYRRVMKERKSFFEAQGDRP